MDDHNFIFFQKFLADTSGYNLVPEKKYLLESRLSDVLKTHKIVNESELIGKLKLDFHSDLANDVIEAMTVNETFFFRDTNPFKTFEEEIIPRLQKWTEPRPYRVWSAACSAGQEPYSIAMVLDHHKDKYPSLSYEVVATDINNTVLAKARHGVYSNLEVHRGLPDHYREKYFQPDGQEWKIKESLARQITFKYCNLKADFNLPGLFDFVMLRNVLIYFDNALKDNILHRVAEKMAPNGYLLLGGAEGIYDPDHIFQRCSEIKGLYKIKK